MRIVSFGAADSKRYMVQGARHPRGVPWVLSGCGGGKERGKNPPPKKCMRNFSLKKQGISKARGPGAPPPFQGIRVWMLPDKDKVRTILLVRTKFFRYSGHNDKVMYVPQTLGQSTKSTLDTRTKYTVGTTDTRTKYCKYHRHKDKVL